MIEEEDTGKKAHVESFVTLPLLIFCWSSTNSESLSYISAKGNLLSRSLNLLTSRKMSLNGSNKMFEIFPISVATSRRLGTKLI